MPDLTPRIGIKKPLGNENVSRASFNENWDIIDAKVATLGEDGKVPADQLTGQNVFSSVSGKTGGTLSTVVADGPSDTLTIEGQGLIQVSADVNTDTIVINTSAEVNQNTFAKVNVNGALVTADFKSDQLNVFPGTGISVSADSPANSMTISLETPTFTNLTLQNGAVAVSGRTPRYTKVGAEVVIEGEIQNIAAGTTIATLPSGYRPPTTRVFKIAHNSGVSNDGVTAYVNTDGTVILQAVANGTNAISLCGIRFYTI